MTRDCHSSAPPPPPPPELPPELPPPVDGGGVGGGVGGVTGGTIGVSLTRKFTSPQSLSLLVSLCDMTCEVTICEPVVFAVSVTSITMEPPGGNEGKLQRSKRVPEQTVPAAEILETVVKLGTCKSNTG